VGRAVALRVEYKGTFARFIVHAQINKEIRLSVGALEWMIQIRPPSSRPYLMMVINFTRLTSYLAMKFKRNPKSYYS